MATVDDLDEFPDHAGGEPDRTPSPGRGRGPDPLPQRSWWGRVTVRGFVRGIQNRTESGNQMQRARQVVTFRLENYGADGDRLRPTPVEMRGASYRGHLSEGDEVRVSGRLRRGVVVASRVRNLTTSSQFATSGAIWWRVARIAAVLITVGALLLIGNTFLRLPFPGNPLGGVASGLSTTVPDLVGKQWSDADYQAFTAGLKTEIIDEQASAGAFGTVLRTDPAAGTEVPLQSTLKIYRASFQGAPAPAGNAEPAPAPAPAPAPQGGGWQGPGPKGGGARPIPDNRGQSPPVETVTVPDVRKGQNADEVLPLLDSRGLVVKSVDVDAPDDTNVVIDIQPPAGTQVPKGSTVVVQLSRGNQAKVPDVTNASVGVAQGTLNQAGFTNIAVQLEQVTDPNEVGTVLDQNPAGDKLVLKTARITIIVGQA